MYKDISVYIHCEHMRYFSKEDLNRAIAAFHNRRDARDPVLLGTLSGIKRRARARAIVDFALHLSPAPPDASITTMRHALVELFGKGLSNNDLQRYFATSGRKADDRVDLVKWNEWRAANQMRFAEDARRLQLDLNREWDDLVKLAAR